MKIVLFRQDMVPSPFVEGLALVVLNGIWAGGGRAEVTTVTKWRDFSKNPHEWSFSGVLRKKSVAFLGATLVPGRLRGLQGVGRNPRSGGDWTQKLAMKGEARIRKNGDAIRSPAHTAAQSIVKIVLFRQDMVPSPFVEGLALVVMYRTWATIGRGEVTAVTERALCPVTAVTERVHFSKQPAELWVLGLAAPTASPHAGLGRGRLRRGRLRRGRLRRDGARRPPVAGRSASPPACRDPGYRGSCPCGAPCRSDRAG